MTGATLPAGLYDLPWAALRGGFCSSHEPVERMLAEGRLTPRRTLASTDRLQRRYHPGLAISVPSLSRRLFRGAAFPFQVLSLASAGSVPPRQPFAARLAEISVEPAYERQG
jgi:hypothetical protein